MNDERVENLRQWLQEHRKEHSLLPIARACGLKISFLYEFERGRIREPSATKYLKLIDYLEKLDD